MSRWVEAAGPLDWSLLSGAVPTLVAVLGFASLAFLLVSRRRAWWLRWAPLALLLAALLTWLLGVVVDDWWQPFPDGLPRNTLVWIGVGILALVLALVRMPWLRARGRVGAAVAVLLVVALAGSKINQQYQEYPTLRAAPGPWQVKPGALTADDRSKKPTVPVPAGKTIADVWVPPAGMPAKGTVSSVAIPGVVSHFAARDGYVYLPPAYLTSPRPLLPVLVLLPGQPGDTDAWINSGQLAPTMDAYAAAHKGLAPVIVMADPLGSTFANTLCMDSRIAQVQTYLARDVPDWISAHLQVATGRTARTIGGLSFGGTCSLQLAVNAPQVYGSFLDLSGQDEPTLGSRSKTVDAAFGGDAAAFAKVNPLDVLARKSFPDTAAALVAGSTDHTFTPQQRRVQAACVKAGMPTNFLLLPGGHGFAVWRAGLVAQLPWLAQHTGLSSGTGKP
ncbi:alpha/beta hydrolase [Streptacidiphilus sp. PAMC 29251]